MIGTENIIAEKALEIALKKGCDHVRITYNISTQCSYSVRNDKLDRLHQANGTSLYIQLFVNGRYGSFSTNRTEERDLTNFIENAIEATKLLSPDPYRALPDPSLYYKGEIIELGQYDKNIENITPEIKSEIAHNCAAEIYNTDKRIVSVNSEYGDSDDYLFIIDSNGFQGYTKQTLFTVSSECSVRGSGDSRPEGWWYESSLSFDKLRRENVGKISLERAISRLNPKKLKSGLYTMVLENTVSSRVVAPIISALNGGAIQQNNSFLRDKLGKKVFSDKFQLTDNPHIYGAAGSRFFDGEGVATKSMNIIENGVVNYYFINTYFSRKLGMPVTIEGPSVPLCKFTGNGQAENTVRTIKEVLKSCERGIFITGFNGGNSNTSTGDFSFGVQGFYFENGEVLHPVKEMNVTGNLITLWNNFIDAGTDPRETARWLIPTLAFESVNFSGL
ncbi:MAG: TldD/PmbA family protein [Bacteroidales bacterium]